MQHLSNHSAMLHQNQSSSPPHLKVTSISIRWPVPPPSSPLITKNSSLVALFFSVMTSKGRQPLRRSTSATILSTMPSNFHSRQVLLQSHTVLHFPPNNSPFKRLFWLRKNLTLKSHELIFCWLTPLVTWAESPCQSPCPPSRPELRQISLEPQFF